MLKTKDKRILNETKNDNQKQPLYQLHIIFSYLECKDLAVLSQTSSYLLTQCRCFGYAWRRECFDFFCSSLNHYQYIFNSDTYFNDLVLQLQPQSDGFAIKSLQDETWRNLFTNGMMIHKKLGKLTTTELPFSSLNDELKDANLFYLDLYTTLQESPIYSNTRARNWTLENDKNTSFQMYLYDLLVKENCIYASNEVSNRFTEQLKTKPFWKLLCYIKSNSITNIFGSSKDKWERVRNYKETSEEDKCFFLVLMCLIQKALSNYCEICKQLITEKSSNPREMLKEYIIRYKNYTEAALVMDDTYMNLNRIMNYLSPLSSISEQTPKYSLLRLFMITWNDKCLAPLKETLGLCVKMLIHTQLDVDISNILSEYLVKQDLFMEDSFNKSTFYSCFQDIKSYSKDQDTQMNSEDNLPQYNVLSYFFSAIIDTFCNKYNIFQINSLQIKHNETYDFFNNIMLEEIGHILQFAFSKNRNKIQNGKLKDALSSVCYYFSLEEHFSEQFILKFKGTIIYKVFSVLSNVLTSKQIEKDDDEKEDNSNESLGNSTNDTQEDSNLIIKSKEIGNPIDNQCLDQLSHWVLKQKRNTNIADNKVERELKKKGLLFANIKDLSYDLNTNDKDVEMKD